MKKKIFLAIGAAMLGMGSLMAQTAIDAYTITPIQLRGSARFVGMGGAFTSLGSDMSCMTQNPAGLGLYRTGDFGVSFDISIRNQSASTNAGKYSVNHTKVDFDNIGYVGVVAIENSALKAFQWGVGYNRLSSFDRRIDGYTAPASGSLTNYIADNTNGILSDNLLVTDDFDAYHDGSEDWLSILAYNSYMISEIGADNQYSGLRNNQTLSDGLYQVREQGYVDEYNIDFAGNINDVFFWGVGVGIVDVDYMRYATYSESLENATVFNTETGYLTTGNAGYELYNMKYIKGSGANLKFGAIVRPIEMLRLGFAIHTPTWLHLDHSGYADVDYRFTPEEGVVDQRTTNGTFSTPEYLNKSRLSSPWRFMLGASAVLGSNAIVSADYERVAYNDMRLKSPTIGMFSGGYETNEVANNDVKNTFRAANIFRLGLEYRLSRSVSARAGYNYQSSAVTTRAENGDYYISTAGMDPSFNLNRETNTLCLGLGYRYESWYVDAAYQYSCQKGTYHAYTTTGTNRAPSADITDKRHNIVISTGFRF